MQEFTYGKALPKAMRLASGWTRKDPPNSHWHIGPIGVLPEYQGNGIGSRLLKESLQIVDENGN
jgi:ribosomal protein S18 acetylase RimI-like enzyme